MANPQIEELKVAAARIRALEAENERLKQATEDVAVVLEEHEQPVYEIISEGYFSPDCVLYPVGSHFKDLTGHIIPNEHMAPINEPARKRMAAWLETLPTRGQHVSIDDLLEAAVALRPREGDTDISNADWANAVLQRALQARFGGKAPAPRNMTMPASAGDAPLMTNTRIQGRDPKRLDPRTEMHREPINPADKAQPPIPRSELLGRHAMAGVTAR